MDLIHPLFLFCAALKFTNVADFVHYNEHLLVVNTKWGFFHAKSYLSLINHTFLWETGSRLGHGPSGALVNEPLIKRELAFLAGPPLLIDAILKIIFMQSLQTRVHPMVFIQLVICVV